MPVFLHRGVLAELCGAVGGAAAALLVGCSSERSMNLDHEGSNVLPRHAVVLDGRNWAAVSPAERATALEEAIVGILNRLPDVHRAEARRILEDREKATAFTSSTDPEIARLLGVITAIRESELRGGADESAGDRDLTAARRSRSVRVTVALVEQLGEADVRATVIRRPGDGGRPLLLVRESSTSATDLAFALSLAANSAARFGPNPLREERLHFRGEPANASALGARAQPLLAILRSSPYRAIPGVGSVRATEMIALADRPTSP